MPVMGAMGNNVAWRQTRDGQLEKHGAERGDNANKLPATRYDRSWKPWAATANT
jgi:hypothetical protein